MKNTHDKTFFHREFPTIIMETMAPAHILEILTTATDRLFGHHALASALDYSKDTTTYGGKQVILHGDQHRNAQEFQDPDWQDKKDLVMNYLARISRHFTHNLIKTCAPWLTKTPEDGYQVIPRNVWALSQYAGDYNAMHVHPGTNVSGVIYLKVPEQINLENAPDGCISFWSNQPLEPVNLQFGANKTMIPKEGDLLMFPSYLPHAVYPFRGPGERRIVSFNAIVLPDPHLTNAPR